ncbi:MAG: imidazolonepropionase [Tannerellaceae bacterium]|jgi:imidazolonepropionase|nr:imidazolonepropionase [Tannerellaceae bacterium]
MEAGKLLIRNASQIATCSGFAAKKGKAMSDMGIIEDGAVAVSDGRIIRVGATQDVLSCLNEEEYTVLDARGKALLPGFVDSHTHFVFGGYREEEFAWRLRGDSYMSIMERGGGIVNTMQATRESAYSDLYKSGYARLTDMMKMGVTTVEGKSGYGLDLETELTQLRVMKELNEKHPVDVVATFLGAHAIPPEYKGRADDYIGYIIETVLPAVAKEKLAGFCDVFCEKGVFSVEQSRRLLRAAQALGMKPKLHADEMAASGGAALAVELNAVSADHLLQVSTEGIGLLAGSNTVATLLPLTAFSLREDYARGRDMIDAGCAVALATDLNPGSCFSGSIPLLIALACIYMKLTPEEAVTALTINGAASAGRADTIGSIDAGKEADMIVLRYPSYTYLPYHTGMNIVETIIKKGKIYRSY